MARIEKSIDVNVPVRTAYNQWTQFGVQEVQQLDAKRLHWRARIGGKEEEWDAEIIEQTPDLHVAWQSTSGAPNAGTVSFQPLGEDTTRVTLLLNYEPQGAMESAGDALGVVSRRVEGDLQRFKEFIEARDQETGAWRGEIHGSEVAPEQRTGL
jgi:uncharacterized membrane protein